MSTMQARRLKSRPKKRRQPKVSLIDRGLAALPVSQATLQRIAAWSITGLVVAGAVALAAWFGVFGMAGTAVAEKLGDAGLRVDRVQVTGAHHSDPNAIYALAFRNKSQPIASLDLAALRRELVTGSGWITDARVSRRLPDTLIVDVVERTPAAVWQMNGRQMLVDAAGVPLEEITPGSQADLPLLVGEGANRQAPAYARLLDAAPALKPMVKAASWVGNRRWNLLFGTGETLQLPEDDADKALVKFAEIDGATPLLGKGWVGFDMREPGYLRARKPDAPAATTLKQPAPTPAPSPTVPPSAAPREQG